MKYQARKGLSLALVALAMPVMIGCSGSTSEPTAQSPSAPQASSTTAGSATTGNQHPSSATLIEEGIETAPAQSVAIFLDSLRKGDERAANGVLTAKAREELAKTPYVIQPLGTPEGHYEIGRVGFPYEEKDVALVECTWTDPPVPGQPQVALDIVCEVHQEAEGWRISALGLSIPGTDEAVVLDFEDAASLQERIDAATGQAPSNATAGQAGTASTSVQAVPPTGFPTYPGASNETSPNQDAFPHIALPPVDGAAVYR